VAFLTAWCGSGGNRSAPRALAQTEIPRQPHDELDAAKLAACGRSEGRGSSVDKELLPPVAPSVAEILECLVTLNRECAEEEKRGLLRWHRPRAMGAGAESQSEGLLSEM